MKSMGRVMMTTGERVRGSHLRNPWGARSRFAVLCAFLFALAGTSPAGAVEKLWIERVEPDYAQERLFIYGGNFGSAPVVLLERTELVVLAASDELIEVELVGDRLPGTYRLLVQRPGPRWTRSLRTDVMDVTLGAVGPDGPAGPSGEAGPQGDPGETGLPGAGCKVTAGEAGVVIRCGDGSMATIPTLSVACAEGQAIQAIAADGGVVCIDLDAGAPPSFELAVTETPGANELGPALGHDGSSLATVYSFQEQAATTADIYFQRLNSDGTRLGDPVRVSNDLPWAPTHDVWPDISGELVVYTALDGVGSATGSIFVYHTGLASSLRLTQASTPVGKAKIFGDNVAWVEGEAGSTVIRFMKLDGFSRGTTETVSVPGSTNVQVGSGFVVWERLNGSSWDVESYGLQTQWVETVAGNPALDERFPATFGDFIVIEAQDPSTNTSTIELADLSGFIASWETIADSGSRLTAASIDEDYITYESDVNGRRDVFAYRRSDGETRQVTLDERAIGNQLNDVFGNFVVYSKEWPCPAGASFDIYLADLAKVFAEPKPSSAAR